MKNRTPIKVAQFGLGPIGVECLKLISQRDTFKLVGAVDIRPDLVGRHVADACGIPDLEGGRIHASFEELIEAESPDVVIHTAGSRAELSFEQCRPMLKHGLAVVSSCEELLFPRHRAPALADEIHSLCLASGGRIVGTGVNPGFVLDLLPVCLSQVCRTVKGVNGRRVVNASLRRGPLQKKIGSGMAPEDFKNLWMEGRAGHAGFQESLLLIAHAFGWQIDEVHEHLDPVIAEHEIRTDHFHVQPGQTRGLHQVVRGVARSGESILLDLTMALDEPDPHDFIRLDSDPPVACRLEGGVSGDRATVASLINAVVRLQNASPGVKLITELGLATGYDA